MTTDDVGYQVLTADTAASYVASRPELAPLIDTTSLARVEEVGDGNLNLVFILTDTAGRGVVLKQALPYMRLVGPAWPMRPDRSMPSTDVIADSTGGVMTLPWRFRRPSTL